MRALTIGIERQHKVSTVRSTAESGGDAETGGLAHVDEGAQGCAKRQVGSDEIALSRRAMRIVLIPRALEKHVLSEVARSSHRKCVRDSRCAKAAIAITKF